jgi:hypothetical protein
MIQAIDQRFWCLKARDSEQRHGTLLSLAAAISVQEVALNEFPRHVEESKATSRKPELYAEALSRLVSSSTLPFSSPGRDEIVMFLTLWLPKEEKVCQTLLQTLFFTIY